MASNDLNLLVIKQIVAFHRKDGTWKIKIAIEHHVDCFMSVLSRMINQEEL